MLTPPNSMMNTSTGQYTAPMAEVAAGESRPTNHVSVAFSTACTALFSMNGTRQGNHGGIVETEARASAHALTGQEFVSCPSLGSRETSGRGYRLRRTE